MKTPFLMHTVIAITTSRRRISPNNSTYKLAEAYHWHQAISQYSREISDPSSVGCHNMDALFSACLLMTVPLLYLGGMQPMSFVGVLKLTTTLNWLRVHGALLHLLGLTHPWLEQSMWYDVLMEAHQAEEIEDHENLEDGNGSDYLGDNEPFIFDDHHPGRIGLHPALADLCNLDESTTENTNLYMCEDALRNMAAYTTFMSRLLPEYFEMLHKKDTPALVLLAWWLALMCQIEVMMDGCPGPV